MERSITLNNQMLPPPGERQLDHPPEDGKLEKTLTARPRLLAASRNGGPLFILLDAY